MSSHTETVGVPDCLVFPDKFSLSARLGMLALGAVAGIAGGLALARSGTDALWIAGAFVAFAGGLLSTWSPCGYSCVSLLRQTGRGARGWIEYLPTFAMHGIGYAMGAVILGSLLGGIGMLLGFSGFTTTAGLGLLAVIGLVYGLHQLDFLKVPYPQRKAQVPHDARQRFPVWFVGWLYGFALGLDYLTYVQTPLLYLMTAAAILTGNIPEAIAIIAVFNLGRFLPMIVNLFPVKDYEVQAWLGRNQERAAMADGVILVATGAALATLLAV